VVPATGGTVDLGNIEADGSARQAKRRQNHDSEEALEQAQDDQGEANDTLAQSPETALPVQDDRGAEADSDGGLNAPNKLPTKAAELDRRLPRAVKRLVSKIRPMGADRVVVPEGFGRELLEAENTLITPATSLTPIADKAGRPMGLELTGLRPNGVEMALGFLDGDIIQSVNGRPMRSPDDVVKLVDSLSGVSKVRVRVKRGTSTKNLSIDVEE
jgi:hypothetical protein